MINASEFTKSTPLRPMGSETEMGLQQMPSVDMGDWLEQAGSNMPSVLAANKFTAWLGNGSKIYTEGRKLDLIESATPEVLSGYELAVYETAGTVLVAMAALAANARLARISKRVATTDVYVGDERICERVSSGSHMSYYTPFNQIDNNGQSNSVDVHAALRSFLSSQNIWAGAGMVTANGYAVHQKSDAIGPWTGTVKVDDHGLKPAYMYHQLENRLEIRSGDGNMSPLIMRINADMTSLVLRMIEHGVFPEDLLLRNNSVATEVMKDVSLHPDQPMDLKGGIMTPAQHQQAIARAGVDFALAAGYLDFPNHELEAAEQVDELCDQITAYHGNPELLSTISDTIDWAAKLDIIKRTLTGKGMDPGNINTGNIEAVAADMMFEVVTPNGQDGMAERWFRSKGNTLNARDLEYATYKPPKGNSRSTRRVAMLRKHPEVKFPQDVRWDSVKIDGLWVPVE